jgi:hypothetical protein
VALKKFAKIATGEKFAKLLLSEKKNVFGAFDTNHFIGTPLGPSNHNSSVIAGAAPAKNSFTGAVTSVRYDILGNIIYWKNRNGHVRHFCQYIGYGRALLITYK